MTMQRPAFILCGSIAFLITVWTASASSGGKPDSSNTSTRSLTHNGLTRSYHLYVPSTYQDTLSTPLVVALHGGGGNGQKMEKLSGFKLLADQNGFIVVYPEAVEHHWNDGRGVDRYRSHRENIDDVGFISAVIDTVARDHNNIDLQRVYVTGASNGAMMCMRLGCESADKITAVAAVIGSMPASLVGRCAPRRPLAVMMINGTADPLVPWQGGDVHVFRRKLGKILSVPDTLAFWASQNGCRSNPAVTWESDKDPADGTRVRKTLYTPCKDGTEVVLYEIQGGGHTWPGGYQYLPEAIIGKTSRDLDASTVIWNFFKTVGHRR